MSTMNFNGATTIGQIHTIARDQTNHYHAPLKFVPDSNTTRNVNIGNVTGVHLLYQLEPILLRLCCHHITGGSGDEGGNAEAEQGAATAGNGGSGRNITASIQ
jgi:hypothetical protein